MRICYRVPMGFPMGVVGSFLYALCGFGEIETDRSFSARCIDDFPMSYVFLRNVFSDKMDSILNS